MRGQKHQNSSAGIDPAHAKWLEWNDAHREFRLRCHQQQRLETQLVEAVGFPKIEVSVPGKPTPVTIQSYADIESWLDGPENAAAREKARGDLSAKLSRWKAEDKVLGYSKARKAEHLAGDRELALAAELWDLPARSIEGVIAKLHAVLTIGISAPGCNEFPWPPLRSVMNDLLETVRVQHFVASNGVAAAQRSAQLDGIGSSSSLDCVGSGVPFCRR
ncbi:hypothetical protein, partial [Rhizobium sp. BR 314]|uniref:hypothetical protein n=1 Tax=Rhizobium sp. BR 314 TaxID=3040013 RepID=UPI0039BFE2B8